MIDNDVNLEEKVFMDKDHLMRKQNPDTLKRDWTRCEVLKERHLWTYRIFHGKTV
jgi:hypothetical protein